MAHRTQLEPSRKTIAAPLAAVSYQSGFGNQFQSEAVPGALPVGRNSPQRAPLGLYAEQISGTAFTAARHENRRTWTYRIWPSVVHKPYRRIDNGKVRTGPFNETEATPSQLRWSPFPIPQAPTDFVDGIVTVGGSGSAADQSGMAVHVYAANASMAERYFYNADGEMLIVPQQGPRGANGLANPRDFQAPVAAYEEGQRPCTVVAKFQGNLWAAESPHSPLSVVAWHGNFVPYKYDLARFMAIGTISFDHPDPSIFTVLTAPSDIAGTANVDFVIFPPRWLVGEDTFRPPWYHRNVMCEFMGLLKGVYDAKAEGFLPGGASLHNCMSAHGPDAETFARASTAELKPHKLDNTLAFMFESRFAMRLTRYAMESSELQHDYFEGWQGLKRHFPAK